MNRQAIIVLAMALMACTTSDNARVSDAASTPLRDLNLVHAAIPAVLVDARKRPYGLPADQDCGRLSAEVRALDEVLGPDLDVPASETNPGLIERGTTAASNAAVGTLQSATEGVVPYRRWVRKLSGAERYSKEVAAAIAAGTVRRAFLKGVSIASGCP